MKYKELSTLKPEELDKQEQQAKLELIKLQAQVATGTAPKNPGQIRQIKKTVARIHTVRSAQQKN